MRLCLPSSMHDSASAADLTGARDFSQISRLFGKSSFMRVFAICNRTRKSEGNPVLLNICDEPTIPEQLLIALKAKAFVDR